jgi:phosphate transport system substrate-binding protein
VRTSRTAALVIGGALVIGVGACGTDDNSTNGASTSSMPKVSATSAAVSAAACADGSLSAQGSTFQANMETQWSKDFRALCSGAQVNYQGTGSGAGIQAIGNGTADFAGSDVTMKDSERAAASAACASTALSLPVTAGGVAITYNLKGVTDLRLSAKTLATIFEGKVTKWNDPAIAAENSAAALPSTPISVFYRNDSSGTTSVFTAFLQAVAGSDWTLGSSKTVSFFPGAQGAKGSAGVTAGVSQTAGGITYVETSFAKGQHLAVASVKGAGDGYVAATSGAVSAAIGEGFAVTGTGNDLAGRLDFSKMTTGYPISTVSYAITCTKYKDAAKGSLVKAYLQYAVSTGQAVADGLGFAPLPRDLVAKDEASISAIS